jgi:hypothetical protein
LRAGNCSSRKNPSRWRDEYVTALGEATRRATDFISKFILASGDKTRLEEELKAIISTPSAFMEDSLRAELAKALLKAPPPPRVVVLA